MLNTLVGYLQLLAFPVFLLVSSVSIIALTVSLMRYLRAQRRLANARRAFLGVEEKFAELVTASEVELAALQEKERNNMELVEAAEGHPRG